MGNDDLRTIRESLDQQLNNIGALIHGLVYQQAAEHLSTAEETFQRLQEAANPSNEIHRTIVENRRCRIETLAREIEDGLQRREVGKKEDGNIAFKCNWNDKGYKGICSDKAYVHNLRFGGPYCLLSRCRDFVGQDLALRSPCYESTALIDFYFAAGWDSDEHGTMIRPRKIRGARVGKIALLTTEPPDRRDRFVVGAFAITKLVEDPGRETKIFGDKSSALDDMLGYEIDFWKYHTNPHNPGSTAWATGLFRYVSNVAALGILEEYVAKKRAAGEDPNKGERIIAALRASLP
ncbi:MAG: hypothetical protein NTZ04_03525 [Chloroflexi bacterium]|nr:hypothetical protein [Chloroflexota bacterium]